MRRFLLLSFVVFVAFIAQGVKLLKVDPMVETDYVGVKLSFDTPIGHYKIDANPSRTVYSLVIEGASGSNFLLPIQVGPLEAVSIVNGRERLYVNFFHLVPVQRPHIGLSDKSMTIEFKRAKRFTEEEYVFTGEEVSLREILKYIMGKDYLNLNYVISEKLETERIKFTMRLVGMGADDVFRDILLAKSGRISYAYLPDGTLYLGTPEEVRQRVDTFWQTYVGVKLSEAGLEMLRSQLPIDTLVEYVPGKGILFVYGDLETHMKVSQLLSAVSPMAQVRYDYSRLSRYYSLDEIGKKIAGFLNRLKTGGETGKALIPDMEFSNLPEAGKAVIWLPKQDEKLLKSLLEAFEVNLINEARSSLEKATKEATSVKLSLRTIEVGDGSLKNDVKAILELLKIRYEELSNGFAVEVSDAQYQHLLALKDEIAERHQAPVTVLRRLSRYIDEDMAKILASMVVPQMVQEFELVLLEGRRLSDVVKLKGEPDRIDAALDTAEQALKVLGKGEVKRLYKVGEGSAEDIVKALKTAFPSLSVELAGKDVLVVRGNEDIVAQAEQFLKGMESPPQERVEELLELPSWAADMGIVDVLSQLFPSADLEYYDKMALLLVEVDKASKEAFDSRYQELLSLAEGHRTAEETKTEATNTTVEASPVQRKILKIVSAIPGVSADALKDVFASRGLEVDLQLVEPFGYLIVGPEPDVDTALSIVNELKEKIAERSYAAVSLKKGVDSASLAALFGSLGLKVDLLSVGEKTLVVGEKDSVESAKSLIEDLSLEATGTVTPISVEPQRYSFQAFALDPTVNVDSLKSLLSKLGYTVDFVHIGTRWVAVGPKDSLDAANAIVDELGIRVTGEASPATSTSAGTKTVNEKTFEIVKLEELDPVELTNVLKLFYPTVTTAHFEKLGILILMGEPSKIEKAMDMIETLRSIARKKSATETSRPASMVEVVPPATTTEEKGATEEKLPFGFELLPDGSFSIDIKDQPLGLVLEIVAEKLGKSLMMIDYPQETIDLKSDNMSWDSLLNLVEEFYPYAVLERDGVTVVRRRAPSAATETAVGTEKYVLKVSHNIDEVAKLVEFYGGTVYTDEANELMVITGISKEVYKTLLDLVKSISSPKPVVKISARIVDKSLLNDFNISSSTLLDLGHAGMSVNSDGGNGQLTIDTRIIDLFDYRKLMEALTDKLKLNANVGLQNVLSNGDILSEPQITTISGEEAKIFVGQKIPYVQGYDENNRPIIAFANPGIELDITPKVRSDGTIFLKIFVKVSDVDYYNPTPDLTYPIEKTRQAETSVIVTGKEAVVIGGLVRAQNTIQENRLPFLGSLPFLGDLFKSESKKKEKSDLLIFITAEVINSGP